MSVEPRILYYSNRISSRADKILKNTRLADLLAAWDENCSMTGLIFGNVVRKLPTGGKLLVPEVGS